MEPIVETESNGLAEVTKVVRDSALNAIVGVLVTATMTTLVNKLSNRIADRNRTKATAEVEK